MYESGDAVLGSIIVKEVDSVNDMTHLCRLCAKCCDSLIPIFHGEGVENDIPMKIKKYLPIEVTETDKLPLQLCLNCCHTLTTWHEFISCCIKADENLKTLNQKTLEHVKEAVCLEQSELKINEAENNSNGDNMHESSVQQTVSGQNSEISETSREKDDGLIQEFPLSSRFCDLEKCSVETIPHFHMKIPQQGREDSSLQVSLEDTNASENFVYSIYVATEDQEDEYYLCDVNKKQDIINIIEDKTIVDNGICTQNNSLSDHNYIKQPKPEPEKVSSATFILKCVKSRLGKTGRKCHSKLVRVNRIVSCSHCKKSFRNEAVLRTHIRIHTGVTPFCCNFCGRRFCLSLSLKRHLNACKNVFSIFKQSEADSVTLKEGNYFSCAICDKRYVHKSHLKVHLKSHYKRQKPKLKCNVCGAKFHFKGELLNHKLQHQESPSYICGDCGKICLTERDLKEHGISHSDERPYKCDTCSTSYKRRSHLMRHVVNGCSGKPRRGRTPHSVSTYICERCGKECKNYRLLLLHNISHTGEHKFKCPKCDQRFAQSGAMTRHMRTVHAGRKDHVCETCGQRFTAKTSLINHMRIHTGEKPYNCSHCSKSFRTQQQHRLHQGVHLDLRPYLCPLCSKRFRRKTHLVVHIRTHTGEKPYACPICGKAFAQKNDMTKHLGVHNKFK